MRQITLSLLCLLITACQTAGPLDEDLPSQILPIGSRLVLKQELTIPAHSAGVQLQGGRVVSSGKGLNQYHPHCRLEVKDVRVTAQTVAADEFVIRRARYETTTVALPSLQKAARFYGGSGPGLVIFRTILDLRSERQPQVRWLTCQQWGDPALDQHVTIREIRQTLGKIFMLQLPAAIPGSTS